MAKCKVVIAYYKGHSKRCTEIILIAENECMLKMSKKLKDPSTAPKSYWSILNWFLNNKKIPSISPIFHNSKVISGFKEKINLFNSFFASQCTPVSNSIVLPDISFHTSAHLNSFNITKKDILAIIKSPDPNKSHGCDNISRNPNKSHGWDNISIKMIKM